MLLFLSIYILFLSLSLAIACLSVYMRCDDMNIISILRLFSFCILKNRHEIRYDCSSVWMNDDDRCRCLFFICVYLENGNNRVDCNVFEYDRSWKFRAFFIWYFRKSLNDKRVVFDFSVIIPLNHIVELQNSIIEILYIDIVH